MWHPCKLQYLTAAAVLFPLGVAGDLSFHPEEESVLGKEFTLEVSVELDEVSVLLNGDDMSDNIDLDGVELETSVRALISDEYLKVGDGRPLELVRVFEELSIEYDSGDEQGSENLDDLEGVSVLFSWNEEEGEYDVAFTEDSQEADEEILDGLLEDMDFRALLPADGADEGDTWDVEPEGVVSVLFPGMRLQDLGSLAEEGEDEIPSEILDQLESLPEGLEMTCEFAGLRELEGFTVGVVEVALEGDSSIDLSSVLAEAFDLPAEADADIQEATVALSIEGQGELLWNVEAGHMVSYSMDADLEVEVNVSASVDVQGNAFDVEGNVLFMGEVTWSAGLSDE